MKPWRVWRLAINEPLAFVGLVRSYGNRKRAILLVPGGRFRRGRISVAVGQDRFDLLVRWCQLIGASPFRMERNPETGRFLRFSFSWSHPLTYWWLANKICYAAALSVNAFKSIYDLKESTDLFYSDENATYWLLIEIMALFFLCVSADLPLHQVS